MNNVVAEELDARIGRRCVNETGCREPTKLQSKEVLQHITEEEGGEGDTDHYENGNKVVAEAVLMSCRCDAEGDSDHKLEYGRNKSDGKGYAHMLEDDLCYGDTVNEACSQVKSCKSAEPGNVSLENAEKAVIAKSVHFVHGVNRFLTYCRATLIDGVDLILDKINGHQSDEEVNDKRNAQQNEHGHK